ncbi:MAG: helix-turn-helix transcriptional regulator [Spirochaetota bacterium]
MNRIDRLTAILLVLQERRRTGDELARRFEVSRRTIMRDVQALCEMGIPVVAEWGPNGGYSIPEGTVGPLALTRAEAFLLLLGLRAVERAPSIAAAATRESLAAKVRALVPATVRPAVEALLGRVDLAPTSRNESEPLPHHEAILAALHDERWIGVEYTSTRGRSTQTLRPEQLYLEEGFWYLRAYSHERGEVRTYRVDRIESLQPAHDPFEDNAVARAAPAYGDPSLPEVVVELTERGAMDAERAFRRLRVHREPDGPRLRVRCPPDDYAWLARAIVGMGLEARAIAPAELVDAVAGLARDIARAYEKR